MKLSAVSVINELDEIEKEKQFSLIVNELTITDIHNRMILADREVEYHTLRV